MPRCLGHLSFNSLDCVHFSRDINSIQPEAMHETVNTIDSATSPKVRQLTGEAIGRVLFWSQVVGPVSLFKTHTQLHLEILFFRKQLEIVARTSPRLRLRPFDRFLFGILTETFSSWKETLLIVKPETVIRWRQRGFRAFGDGKANTPAAGRRSYKSKSI
jgi:hypothetical protein